MNNFIRAVKQPGEMDTPINMDEEEPDPDEEPSEERCGDKRKGLSEMKHPTTLLLIESSCYFPIPQFRAYSYSVPLIAE